MKILFVFTGVLLCLQILAQEQGSIDSTNYYYANGQYARALPFAKKNFEMLKETNYGDGVCISAAHKLAGIYYALLMLDSSLVYFIKASEWAKERHGEGSVQYGGLLSGIATIYGELGKYPEAEEKFQNATAILNKIDSSYKNTYTSCLIAQAGFYITTGNLNKAEELCLKASEIALKEPVNMDKYSSSLDVQARLYEKMGFYAKLRTIIVQQFEIRKKLYGEKNPRFANAIAGLAHLCELNQNLQKADSLYRKALEIKRQALGKNSVATISILIHIAEVNMEMKKYKIAEKYLKEAGHIIYENGGEESSLYLMYSSNLARLYSVSGRKLLAEKLFKKSIAMYDKMGLELHSNRLNLLHDMAELLYDKPVKASVFLKEAMVAENKLLLEKLNFLSETELQTYLKANHNDFDSPYRFLLLHKNAGIEGAAYNNKLLVSGIGLQNARVLYQNMAQSKDSALATLWNNYLAQKSLYTNLLQTPIAKRNTNTDSIANMLNQEEKDILRKSADYRNMKEQLALKWQDVRDLLQPDETAIEFVRFNSQSNMHSSTKAGTVYYAALLLGTKDTVPKFVTLCEEKQLIAAIKKFPWKAAVSSRGRSPQAYVCSSINALYKLVWQPLEPYLNHTQTIYFSPDGLLHKIAFAAIPYSKTQLLCDKYNLVQLTSTRQIKLRESQVQIPVSIAMFGGINYNFQSADTSLQLSGDSYTYLYRENRSAGLDSFRFLPNTLKEINTITTNAEALQKQPAIFKFTANNATEAAFRKLGGNHSPEVLHFATHGFTLPDISGQKSNAGAPFKASENPLLRCGLIMAGGNKGWKGKAGPNEDDGILTGLEISSVQLPNTQLAVLSACETGLGKIEGSEGVFGLQRAFKLAGVNYVMASLWQVPDKETAEFMETFYSQWLAGKTIRQAFFNTQQFMRKKYAPYYWAGFTLVQ